MGKDNPIARGALIAIAEPVDRSVTVLFSRYWNAFHIAYSTIFYICQDVYIVLMISLCEILRFPRSWNGERISRSSFLKRKLKRWAKFLSFVRRSYEMVFFKCRFCCTYMRIEFARVLVTPNVNVILGSGTNQHRTSREFCEHFWKDIIDHGSKL
jgi:hypothetical protein